MQPHELIVEINSKYPKDKWPDTYLVDADTYARVCNYVFWVNGAIRQELHVSVRVGRHGGIVFKNTELMLIRPEIRND